MSFLPVRADIVVPQLYLANGCMNYEAYHSLANPAAKNEVPDISYAVVMICVM